jgi:adenylate cyclase
MFTDMVGYTALGQRNETLSLALVDEQRKLIRPILFRHNGREVKTIGDAFLVEFPNALDAVRCAYDVQRAVHEFNISVPEESKIQLRVGVHLGDVVESGGDISGDAVNIASRIEPLAENGGVCVTRQVYDNVIHKFSLPLISIGPKVLKNVIAPMEVYKMEMPWSADATGSPTKLDRKRIAVLPFSNLSSDPEEGYFADGVTEELITVLSGVRQLTVIARTSVMGYKGTTKKAKEIGKELDVGSMLEGSVRKAGNRVRITAQLIETTTEGHLWAQNYDRQLEDVFAIQSEIAEKVAGELKIRLLADELRLIEKKPTENTQAYTYYLRALELARERTEPSVRQAIEIFEETTQLDPFFARAFVRLAECFINLVNDGYEPADRMIPKAEISVKKAFQLDPHLAEAYAIDAYLRFTEDDVPGGEASAKRAIELNPSLSEAHWALSNLALMKQDIAEGIRASEACYRLDPMSQRNVARLGQFYFYLGMEKEALQHWEKTVHLAPAGTFRFECEYYLYKGDVEKAKEFYSKVEKLEPTNSWLPWMKGFIAATAGDRDTAIQQINQIEKIWRGAVNLNDIGFIYHALGDLDSYFTYIIRATEQHAIKYAYVMYCPLLAKSREDPRYQEVLARLRRMYEPAPK